MVALGRLVSRLTTLHGRVCVCAFVSQLQFVIRFRICVVTKTTVYCAVCTDHYSVFVGILRVKLYAYTSFYILEYTQYITDGALTAVEECKIKITSATF